MLTIPGLIDIRHQLYRYSGGGPNRRVAWSQRRGAVVHYNGETPVGDEMAALISDSIYHVQVKDWDEDPTNGAFLRGDGIMYHVAVLRDGRKLWLRDFEAALWHSGTSKNTTAFALLAPLGGQQRATPAQLRGLAEVCDAIATAGLGAPAEVWGHQEVSPTRCPGTLMADFVEPYRAGTLLAAVAPAVPDWQARVDAYWQDHAARLGAVRVAGWLARPDWGNDTAAGYHALICQHGVLIAVGEEVWEVTGRVVDDFLTLNEQVYRTFHRY